ncbi:unnamed protein product [Amoebophrya sp. A25]|nr:unnamed protein product [Amoebophrya sp. A25]|eukprot:GSA25T00012647001.1
MGVSSYPALGATIEILLEFRFHINEDFKASRSSRSSCSPSRYRSAVEVLVLLSWKPEREGCSKPCPGRSLLGIVYSRLSTSRVELEAKLSRNRHSKCTLTSSLKPCSRQLAGRAELLLSKDGPALVAKYFFEGKRNEGLRISCLG